MMKRIVPVAVLLALGAGITAFATSGRAARPDCPGTIVCPLTGEAVCKDRCPLGATAADEAVPLPACCRQAR